jgi:hypothetical protein
VHRLAERERREERTVWSCGGKKEESKNILDRV